MHQKDRKTRHIGGQIDHLRLSIGSLYAHFRKDGERDNQKGAGSGTVKAVVKADDQRRSASDEHRLPVGGNMIVPVIVEQLLIQYEKRRYGDHHRENRQHDLLGKRHREIRAERRSDYRTDHRGDAEAPVDETSVHKPARCNCRSAAAGKLVGCDSRMNRKSRQQISR